MRKIFGASKPEHVLSNAECINFHLDDAVMREVRKSAWLDVDRRVHSSSEGSSSWQPRFMESYISCALSCLTNTQI